jgi:hypothetical protein
MAIKQPKEEDYFECLAKELTVEIVHICKHVDECKIEKTIKRKLKDALNNANDEGYQQCYFELSGTIHD